MLFKFIEKKWMDEFFKTGSIRLGTILDFGDTIAHGNCRGDSSEGKHAIKRTATQPVTLTKHHHEPIFSEYIKTDSDSVLNGITVIVPRRSQDGFVFCTSNQYCEQLFKRWFKEVNADACYQIIDIKGFCDAVSEAIKSTANFAYRSDCIYTEEVIDWRSPDAKYPPSITKNANDYKWQREHRFIWAPLYPSPPLKKQDIYAPEAIKFCKKFAYLDDDKIHYY